MKNLKLTNQEIDVEANHLETCIRVCVYMYV